MCHKFFLQEELHDDVSIQEEMEKVEDIMKSNISNVLFDNLFYRKYRTKKVYKRLELLENN